MQTMQSAWNALILRLQTLWETYAPRLDSFWNAHSPQHPRLYLAGAAVLLVVLLIARGLVGSSRGPATLSLNQPSKNSASRRRASFNQSPLDPPSINPHRHGAITPAWATVTPIDRAPATRCTHCDASLPASSSFCPACGFAQPAAQTGTGAGR